MLYSNVSKGIFQKEYNWGKKLQYIQIGEEGIGRKFSNIPAEAGIESIKTGMNENISVGSARKGRPKIIQGDDKNLYLLISTQGRYSRRANGRIIGVLADETSDEKTDSVEEKMEILDMAYGAYGDAGRVGNWEEYLLKVKDLSAPFTIKIKPSRGACHYLRIETNKQIYYFHTWEEYLAYIDHE